MTKLVPQSVSSFSDQSWGMRLVLDGGVVWETTP